MSDSDRARWLVTITSTGVLAGLMAMAAWLGHVSGGYDLYWWTPAAVATCVVLAIAIGVSPPRRERFRSWPVRVALASALALVVWTAISISWSDNRQLAFEELGRTGWYAAALLAGVIYSRSRQAVRWAMGTWVIGTAIVAVQAMRAMAKDQETVFIGGRWLGSIEYHNGQAAFLLVPVLAGVALAAQRDTNVVLRAALVGAICILVPAAVLPQSRGGALALLVASIVYLAMSPQRVRSLVVMAAPALATWLLWGRLARIHSRLVNDVDVAADLTSIVRMIGAVAIAFTIVAAIGALVDRERELPEAWATWGSRAVGAACAIAVVAVIVATPALHHPVREFNRQLDVAVDPPATAPQAETSTLGRFATFGNASTAARVVLWKVAREDIADHPLTGVGPANYDSTFYQRRENVLDRYVQQPHNLTLELAAERGIVGWLLALTVVVCAFVTAARVRLGDATLHTKALVAGLVGSVTYWLAHAQVEWLWQISGASLGAIVAIGMLLGLPWRYRTQARRVGWPVRAGLVAVLVVLAALPVAPMIADRAIHDGEHELDQVEPQAALADLDRAAAWAPWSPDVEQLRANALAQLDRVDEASEAVERARSLNPDSWTVHAFAGSFYSQVDEPAKAREAFEQAAERNPLEPDLDAYR